MAQANSEASAAITDFPHVDPTRRRLLTVAAGAAAAAVATKAVALPLDDSELLKLEEQIFEQYNASTSFDDEIWRLHRIYVDEAKRLNEEARAGRCTLTEDERWALVGEMPECKECTRLEKLRDPFDKRVDELIQQMWQIPARTEEGRRAKAIVLLGCILGDDWRGTDQDTDYHILHARALLIEFIGGEPGEMLRDQFASVPS
jgi:hypothetical protein